MRNRWLFVGVLALAGCSEGGASEPPVGRRYSEQHVGRATVREIETEHGVACVVAYTNFNQGGVAIACDFPPRAE